MNAAGEDNPFGFARPPFHVTPDSTMIYAHRRYEEAMTALQYGLESGKGFIVITGEVGAGKTTLLRRFLARIGERMRTAVIFNTGLAPDELLAAIADDLEAPGLTGKKKLTRKMLIDAINAVLLQEFEAGRGVAILIDEAQNLPVESLEILRMLSNLETETEKLLQIVLIGQPELQAILARPDLAQLRSRVAVTYHLMPMTEKETAAYIAHRIAEAHPVRPIRFSSRAVRRIQEYAGGIPRIINILCDQALLASDGRTETIEVAPVETVIESFEHLDVIETPPIGARIPILALAFAAVVLTVYATLTLNGKSTDVIAAPGNAAAIQTQALRESAVARILRLHGAPMIPGASRMTLEAVARLANMALLETSLKSAAVERLGLPALVMPGNGVLTNQTPVLVTSVKEGVWTIETEDQGRIEIPIKSIDVPLHFFTPRRPWMSRVTRRGMRGADIETAQKILKNAGFLVNEPNGYFGAGTTAAVAAIQARLGVDEGRTIGPATMLGIAALERGHLLPDNDPQAPH